MKKTWGPSLSIESWLINKNPYNGLLSSPHNWVVFHPPYTLINQVFFIAHVHLSSHVLSILVWGMHFHFMINRRFFLLLPEIMQDQESVMSQEVSKRLVSGL